MSTRPQFLEILVGNMSIKKNLAGSNLLVSVTVMAGVVGIWFRSNMDKLIMVSKGEKNKHGKPR